MNRYFISPLLLENHGLDVVTIAVDDEGGNKFTFFCSGGATIDRAEAVSIEWDKLVDYLPIDDRESVESLTGGTYTFDRDTKTWGRHPAHQSRIT
jgi:hypothetical protein